MTMPELVIVGDERGSLHALGCTGPDEASGCVCAEPQTAWYQKPATPRRNRVEEAVMAGMDGYLSAMESLLIAIEQRGLSEDQLDRFARLLAQGEALAIERVKKRPGRRPVKR